jgi:hypothetical protein
MYFVIPVSDMRIDEISPIVIKSVKGNKINTVLARFDAVY